MTPLQRARKSTKQTLEFVAAAVDSDTGNISRIERGIQTPSMALTKKLVKHFGPPLSDVQILCPEKFSDKATVAPAH